MLYNEETGEHYEMPDGTPVKRSVPPPCRTPMGCPKGTPEEPRSLTPRNAAAYLHYRRCKATGNFPDDWIVARDAAIIEAAESEAFNQLRERYREKQASGRTTS